MSLQFVAAFDNPFGSSDIANTPTCHGISLADTVDDDGALLHALKLGDGFVLADIVDVLINLVCQYEEVFVAQDDIC